MMLAVITLVIAVTCLPVSCGCGSARGHRRRPSSQRARKWYGDPERSERRTPRAIYNEAMTQGKLRCPVVGG